MILLFEYGKLQDLHAPSNVSFPGVLRLRLKADDPAAKFNVGPGITHYPGEPRVYGQLHRVNGAAHLQRLRAEERPQYRLTLIQSPDAAHPHDHFVYAFSYVGDDWGKMPVIRSGRWAPYKPSA